MKLSFESQMYFKYNLKAIVTSNVMYPFSIVRHRFLIKESPTIYLRYVKKKPQRQGKDNAL